MEIYALAATRPTIRGIRPKKQQCPSFLPSFLKARDRSIAGFLQYFGDGSDTKCCSLRSLEIEDGSAAHLASFPAVTDYYWQKLKKKQKEKKYNPGMLLKLAAVMGRKRWTPGSNEGRRGRNAT